MELSLMWDRCRAWGVYLRSSHIYVCRRARFVLKHSVLCRRVFVTLCSTYTLLHYLLYTQPPPHVMCLHLQWVFASVFAPNKHATKHGWFHFSVYFIHACMHIFVHNNIRSFTGVHAKSIVMMMAWLYTYVNSLCLLYDFSNQRRFVNIFWAFVFCIPTN